MTILAGFETASSLTGKIGDMSAANLVFNFTFAHPFCYIAFLSICLIPAGILPVLSKRSKSKDKIPIKKTPP